MFYVSTSFDKGCSVVLNCGEFWQFILLVANLHLFVVTFLLNDIINALWIKQIIDVSMSIYEAGITV